MSKYNYDGPESFRPISAWGYIGYSILFMIPVVGLILMIVFSLDDSHINRRNYARSFFCWLLLMLIAIVVAIATGGLGILIHSMQQIF